MVLEHADRLTGDPQYFTVVRGILDYLMRDMTHPDGGIFSAEVGAPPLPPFFLSSTWVWPEIS